MVGQTCLSGAVDTMGNFLNNVTVRVQWCCVVMRSGDALLHRCDLVGIRDVSHISLCWRHWCIIGPSVASLEVTRTGCAICVTQNDRDFVSAVESRLIRVIHVPAGLFVKKFFDAGRCKSSSLYYCATKSQSLSGIRISKLVSCVLTSSCAMEHKCAAL